MEYISKLMGVDVTDVNVNFNYDKPIDTNNLMTNLKLQYDMGAISKESILRNSPYVSDVDRELELIEQAFEIPNKENSDNSDSEVDEDEPVVVN